MMGADDKTESSVDKTPQQDTTVVEDTKSANVDAQQAVESPDTFSLPRVLPQSSRKGPVVPADPSKKVWKPTATHAAASETKSSPVQPFRSMVSNQPGSYMQVAPGMTGSFSPYQPAVTNADDPAPTSTAAPPPAADPAADPVADPVAAPAQPSTGSAKDSSVPAESPAPPASAESLQAEAPASEEPAKVTSPPVTAAKTTPKRRKRVAAKSVLTGKIADPTIVLKKITPRPPASVDKKTKSIVKKKDTSSKPKVAKASRNGAKKKLEKTKKKKVATPTPKVPTSSRKGKKSPGSGSNKPKEVECCDPTEAIEGGWPPGWKRRTFQRMSGATKGTNDKYWYSPVTNKKFRSLTEVKKFLACLKSCSGDEEQAWRAFKGK